MSDRIMDGAILIDYLRGRVDAVKFVTAASLNRRARSHLFVAAEFIAGARDKLELSVIDSFIQTLAINVPSEADGMLALAWYRDFRLSHGVDWPDCQIAATAQRLGLPVITLNTKHFVAFPGLQVTRPY